MVENDIKSEAELFAIADEQKKAGKKDLANFVLSRSTKGLSDLLENTRKLESGSKKVFCLKQTPGKWFMSIPMENVHTPVVENGWTVL